MFHPTLYKKDTKGNVREWRIEQEGDRYRTIAGLADGEQVTSGWTTAKGKNIGRSNETTAEEQATSQIESIYEKKLKVDYHLSLADINTDKIYKPMLAASWEKRVDKIDWNAPVFVQPKLDGIRCIANRKGLWSRTGKPIVAVPHIFEALRPLFERFPDLVVDGELYNHDLKHDFNQIVSMVRKTNPNAADLALAKDMVEYHVYDLPSDVNVFSSRISTLREIVKNIESVICVETIRVHSKQEADDIYGEHIGLGYEGGMIRLDAPYEQKRSNTLIKRKDFEDDEFEIVSIEEGNGNWAGLAKRVFFKNNDGTLVGAGFKGNKEYAAQVLAEADQYIGKQATIQFFTRTPDGIPRFPIAKVLHKDKRW